MPNRNYGTFIADVKRGNIPSVVYLHGSEDVLKDEAIDAIASRVLEPSTRDFNLDIRSATTLDPEEAEILCTSLPMLADRRLAVIRDTEAWNRRAKAKGAILRYLAKPAPETVLVLVQGSASAAPDDELRA